MSWSLSFTGCNSIIKDSTNRVVLTTSIIDLDSEEIDKWETLCSSYFLHFQIIIPASYKVNCTNADSIRRRFEKLLLFSDRMRNSNDIHGTSLFFSLQVTEPDDNAINILISSEFKFDLWIINAFESRQSCLQSILKIHQHLQTMTEECRFSLGAGNLCCHDDVDWLLQLLPPKTIQLVHIGNLEYPNLRARTIELVQCCGYNALLNVNETEMHLLQSARKDVCDMASNYNVTADTFIVKCLMQIGCLVAFPLSCDHGLLINSISRLCHPFAHRKLFASAVHVFALQVEPHDLQNVLDASEELEAQTDSLWLPYATAKSQPRALLF